MKFKSIILVAILIWCGILPGSAKSYCTPIYVFGLSASFNDSIVYITNIQLLDSAWVDEKTHFLVNRSDYSSQFKSYFTSKGQMNRTCVVVYAEKEKDILKKYSKMKSRYTPSKKNVKNFDLRSLDEEDFKFESIQSFTQEETEGEVSKKAAKKAAKNAEKAKKRKEKGKLDKKNKKASTSGTQDTEMLSLPPRH